MLYIIIVAAGIAAILGNIYWYLQNQGNPINYLGMQGTSSPTPTIAGQPNSSVVPSTLSYVNALKVYSKRHIQFSISAYNYCTMTPYSDVFKIGTSVMLDNRSKKALTIYLDKQPYSIGAYGFSIINLSTPFRLPHTIKIDCNTRFNVGSILLEK